MKTTTLIFALAFSISAFAAGPSVRAFDGVDEIRDWAAKESFGARVEVLRSGDAEVAIVCRSFTSGLKSCIFSVFAKVGERWVEALSLAPYSGVWLVYEQHGDIVTVRSDKEGKEVFRFSIPELNAHVFEMKKAPNL
jgi:hypothetical protein